MKPYVTPSGEAVLFFLAMDAMSGMIPEFIPEEGQVIVITYWDSDYMLHYHCIEMEDRYTIQNYVNGIEEGVRITIKELTPELEKLIENAKKGEENTSEPDSTST